MLIDTHCHVNFNAYKNDADEVIKRSLANDTWLINVGSQSTTSGRAVEYAQEFKEGVYAAVALHPIHLFRTEIDEAEISFKFSVRGEAFDYNFYKKLAEDKKTVAIGETGLDYYHWPEGYSKEEVRKNQREVFEKHLDLAEEMELPAIIHCREAHDDIMEILKRRYEREKLKERGVLHCFSGDLKLAREYIELGFLISFTGLITFVKDWDKVIAGLPLEKLMVETDAPYLTPEPFRGKRNEPLYVKYVAEKIAKLKGLEFEEVAEATWQNALRLFSKIKTA
ncbi:MAG: TatD family hydrolase [Patescibacteria group bacterium]|nr:TatD family hydrolase [Patescibacteria group bacterium]MDD5490430.1 TatD family hydrolase [Patescibacteria group bacterium]